MSKGVVLVADDDNAIRTVLNQALKRAGFDVRVTSNFNTLLQWVSTKYIYDRFKSTRSWCL